MATRYQYSPLSESPREIRILRIGPGILNCHLEHVPLDTQPPPEYETISYCWGDPTTSEHILVDGARLPVPVNTWKALNRFAGVDGPRKLWIDAVCINQEDELERGHQVILMRDIYSRGKQNLVYLGIEDQVFADKVIDIFRMLDAELKEDDYFQKRLPIIAKYDIPYAAHPVQSSFDEQLVSTFFSNEWFNRLWIFQETCLAKQSLCILGSSSMDLNVILVIAHWLRQYHFHHISRHLQNHVKLMYCSDTLNDQKRYQASGKLSMEDALDIGQRLKASEPHDRVYALLGLMSEQVQESQALKPDYSKSWQEVFRDATREALRDSSLGNGLVLSLISHRHATDIHSQGLPSWVPDLRRHQDLLVDPVNFRHSTRPGRARVSGSAEVLRIEGWVISTVKFISDVADFDNFTYDELASWFEEVALMAQDGSNKHADELARTLMADRNWQQALTTRADHCEYYFLVDHLENSRAIPTIEVLNRDSKPEDRSVARFRQAVTQGSDNRRFAVTKDRRFLLVPKITEPSDIVVDVGFEYHLVLRKARKGFSTKYIFLGQCYVNGCMRWQDGYEEHIAKLERETFEII